MDIDTSQHAGFALEGHFSRATERSGSKHHAANTWGGTVQDAQKLRCGPGAGKYCFPQTQFMSLEVPGSRRFLH